MPELAPSTAYKNTKTQSTNTPPKCKTMVRSAKSCMAGPRSARPGAILLNGRFLHVLHLGDFCSFGTCCVLSCFMFRSRTPGQKCHCNPSRGGAGDVRQAVAPAGHRPLQQHIHKAVATQMQCASGIALVAAALNAPGGENSISLALNRPRFPHLRN